MKCDRSLGRHARVLATAGLIAAASLIGAPTASAQLDTVVERDDDAPPASTFYKKFRRPDASDSAGAGTVFVAKVRGTNGLRGIFTEDTKSGGTAGDTVALERTLAPNGKAYRRLSRPSSNSLGDVAWQARLSGGSRGVFLRSGPKPYAAAAQVVSLVGDPVATGGLLDKFTRPVLTDLSGAVFHASISGGPLNGGVVATEGLFRCSGGDGNCSSGTGVLTALAQVGDLETSFGRQICDFYDGSFGASDFGAAFVASTQVLCSDLLESPVDAVLRLVYGGLPEIIALVGNPSEPSPGAGGTVYAELFGPPAMQSTGIVAFLGLTGGLQVDETIWVCDPVSCPAAPAEARVSEGDADGGVGLDARITERPLQAIGISNAGDVSFQAGSRSVAGQRGRGIWIRRLAGPPLERVAVKGDPTPGAPVPTIFRKIYRPSPITPGGALSFRAKIKRVNGGGSRGEYHFQ